MHGQNREKYKSRLKDPISSAAIAQKANKWNLLSKEILVRRGKLSPPSVPPSATTSAENTTTTIDDENIQLTEKMLSLNPDPSHLWNFRRELLLKSNKKLFVIENELKLTAVCLQKNPKAYAAWTHRKYCVRLWLLHHYQQPKNLSSSSSKDNKLNLLGNELNLCGDFLKSDERNFHCWNYRRFIVASIALAKTMDTDDAIIKDTQLDLDGSWPSSTCDQLMGPQLSSTKSDPSIAHLDESLIESEWNFTLHKIQSNFSNYSAFHYRSKILPLMLPSSKTTYNDVLTLARSEILIIQNAIFTEPDDQTAWWYHHFIINWADPKNYHSMENVESGDYISLLEEDADSIRELIEMEEGQCKWGLLALLMLLRKLVGFHKDKIELKQEAEDCLIKLKDIDPDRLQRYESMRL